MKVINTATGKVYGEIATNHSMTIEEAMGLVGLEMTDDNICDINGPSWNDQDGEEFFYDDINIVSTRGGKRPGAGRPATGAKPSRTFRLDDAEYQKVKEYIKRLRTKPSK